MKFTMGLAGLSMLPVIALSGCGGAAETTAGDAAPQTTASASAAPAADKALLSSVPGAEEPAYAYASSGACFAMSGVVDVPHKSMSGTVSEKVPEIGGSLSMTFLVIEAEKHYVKIGFKPASIGKRLGVPAGWLAVDPAKIDDLGDSPYSYDGETDPLGAGTLVGTATDIERTGDGTFTGTADLSGIAASHPVLDEEEITSLGAKAKKVPFTAAVDTATGKLAKVTVRMPSGGKVKGGTCTLAYSGYGSTAAPVAPAKAKKANATVYGMLNG